jgi:transcriptional antiterminator RfaH
MTTDRHRWYVVQTHPHAENTAASHLLRQGFDTYLPRYAKTRRHARGIETLAAPLFPRYLFVAFDLMAQRWRPIQSTFGVTSIVCNGNEPATLAESVITEIRGREDERGLIRLIRRPRLVPGDKIRVVAGTFSNCLGVFEGIADRERVAILLNMLGRQARVLLDGDLVAAI